MPTPPGDAPPRRIVRGWRITSTILQIVVVESLVIGIAALPAVAFWNWIGGVRVWEPWILRTMVLSVSLVPAYLLFACALMALTALFCRGLRWYAPRGEHSIRALSPEVLRWVKYSVAGHVVRMLCGELFRATPVWSWFVRAMGASVGRGVHINSKAIYDFNLVTLEERVVVGGRAQISCHFVEGGLLKVAPVVFRKGSTIGTASIVSPGVEVGEGGQIGALSFATKHTRIPAHTAYGGVPARFLKRFEPGVRLTEEILYREPPDPDEREGRREEEAPPASQPTPGRE
jgi:acetyltransferase-like isoleucine patch superfamily enzyme